MQNTNLYRKMHLVMSETKSLERDKEVGYGNNKYKAISESSVLNEIKPLFKKYGLIIFPAEIQVNDRVDTFLVKDGESSRLMTQVIHKWKIVDTETGEFDFIMSVGNGVDTQDKSSGKAQTYSLKSALQKTFMMFSGEDTDNEHSDAITERQTKANPTKADGTKTERPNEIKKDTSKLKKVVELYDQMDEKFKAAVMKGYGIVAIEDLPVNKYDDAINAMVKKLDSV